MNKIKSYLVILTISIVSYSCLPVPAHATINQLKSVYASIQPQKMVIDGKHMLAYPPDANGYIKMIPDTQKSVKTDSVQKVLIAPAAPAPDQPTWLDKVFKLLKWVIPGIIILLRIIPTSKNVDIIALLNWLLDVLIPNLTKTPNGGISNHDTTPVIAHRTFVGRIIGSILGT